jgi:phosphoglycolate phosphatase-like HAD superfamily hydrolase
MPPSHQGTLPAPTAILFDWDNTLIDPCSVFQHTNNRMGMPDAEKLLQAITESGLPVIMGVVSNKQGAILREEVQAIGWSQYFHTVVGAMDAARDKPYPDPALLALAELDILPSKHIWFVGDSMADISCACSAGLTAIGFGGKTSYLIQGEVRPALHVASHQELWQVIQQLS